MFVGDNSSFYIQIVIKIIVIIRNLHDNMFLMYNVLIKISIDFKKEVPYIVYKWYISHIVKLYEDVPFVNNVSSHFVKIT